jgi:hypothetical protein
MAKQEDPKKKIQDLNEELGYFEDQVLSIANLLSRTVKDAIEDIREESAGVAEIFEKRLTKSIKDFAKSSDEVLKNQIKILSGTAKTKDIEKDKRDLLFKQLSIQKNLEILVRNEIISKEESAKLSAELTESYESQLKLLDGQLLEAKKIQKTLGLTGSLVKGISKIPILGNIVDTNEALKEMNAAIAKGGGRWAAMKAGIKSIGKDIFDNLTDPLTVIVFTTKKFFDLLTGVDKSIGDLAKGMNITYEEAGKLRKELSLASLATQDEFVTTQGLQESLLSINKILGTNARVSNETLVAFTKLRERAGYTNEELAEFQRLTSVIGGDLEGNVAKFSGTVKLLNTQNKLSINERQLLKETLKVSDAIKLSVGGTVENIAKAAFKTKQFGINLEQADKIAESLLNFESSIQNELEAELITGKDLNFERARLLSLNGDIAGASAEILKQVKGSEEFSKMNRIQQEAIAKAVGMSREDLAKSLVDREALAKLGGEEGTAQERYNQLREEGRSEAEIAAILGSESLARQYEQNSVAEELNMLVQQLQELFVPIAEELLPKIKDFLKDGVAPIIEKIGAFVGKMVDNFGAIWTVLKTIGAFMAGKLVFQFSMMAANAVATLSATRATGVAQAANLPRETAITAEKTLQATAATVTAEASSFGTATPFIIAGIAAVAAAAAAFTLIGDGMIDPKGGLVVSGEKGTYKLDKNDYVVAGTDLGKKQNPGGGGGGGGGSVSIDMAPVVAELQNVKAVLNQILSKEGTVNMDSTKVGTSTNIGTYKVQ